jgi:hypothetical protein
MLLIMPAWLEGPIPSHPQQLLITKWNVDSENRLDHSGCVSSIMKINSSPMIGFHVGTATEEHSEVN